MAKTLSTLATQRIAQAIVVLRDQRVILDRDLADIYGVTTKRLNEQVKRNAPRFPSDFVFQVTVEEAANLRSQFATLESGRGQHRKYRPYAFTEHGAIMTATVINSPLAVEMSIYVVRAFVQLRNVLASNEVLGRRLNELEARIEAKLSAHDQAIAAMLDRQQRAVEIERLLIDALRDARERRLALDRSCKPGAQTRIVVFELLQPLPQLLIRRLRRHPLPYPR